MRFFIVAPEQISDDLVQQAYLTGVDRTPWPVRISREGDRLLLEREVSESANVHVPWWVEGHGLLTLSSGSLMEQSVPYFLPVELARGTLNQLRNQLFEWQAIGLVAPPAVGEKLAVALLALSWAAVRQDEPEVAAALSQDALRAALDASQLLAAAYAEQALAVRRRGTGKVAAVLGADLETSLLDAYTARQFLAAFNAAVVPISWRDVEASEGTFSWSVCDAQIQWCHTHGLKVCAGPLIHLDPRSLPDWLYLWEDDFDNLSASMSHFISAVVARYRGKVDLWQCAGRFNTAETLSLSEEEKLQLAATTIRAVQALDSQTPALISFDQPWSEYMDRREVDFPPLHFADALVRAGLGLNGLVLEINLGYQPGCTLPRTPLEFSRQLDYWSLLGLPLYVALGVPSGEGDDPLARRRLAVPPGCWNLQAQQAWIARYVPLILAKPAVQGVLWSQLRDSVPHDFPHAGLLDERCHAKPALRALATIRQTLLK
ncbi:MAG: endo-1,4-beta-xylanase [Thermoguttaceae bacterium]